MPELLQRVQYLENEVRNLKNAGSISNDVEQALRTRFQLERLDVAASFSVSSKLANSENQAVNEAGAASYSVLNAPDGFVQATVGGTTYYLPAFT